MAFPSLGRAVFVCSEESRRGYEASFVNRGFTWIERVTGSNAQVIAAAARCRRAAKEGGLTYEPAQRACQAVFHCASQIAVHKRTKDEKKRQLVSSHRVDRPRPNMVAPPPSPPTLHVPYAPSFVAAPPATSGSRIALIIRNAAYRAVPNLHNPGRDADLVAATLRNVGFQTVILEKDLSREKLLEALRIFARQSEQADWGLVYFAGHGVELGGVNYLVPIDARLEIDRDIQFEAIALDQVLASAGLIGLCP